MNTTLRPLLAAIPLLAALLLPACASSGDGSQHTPPRMRVEHVTYFIQPLDSLEIQAPDKSTQTVSVDADGNVSLPDGTTLALADKNGPDVRALVAQKWKGAQVIRIIQFHGDRISILGEVQRPTNLPIADAPMTLMDAIASTGGFTTLANRRHVTLLRQNAEEVRIYTINAGDIMTGKNLEQNIFLQSGDIVTVPRSFL